MNKWSLSTPTPFIMTVAVRQSGTALWFLLLMPQNLQLRYLNYSNLLGEKKCYVCPFPLENTYFLEDGCAQTLELS